MKSLITALLITGSVALGGMTHSSVHLYKNQCYGNSLSAIRALTVQYCRHKDKSKGSARCVLSVDEIGKGTVTVGEPSCNMSCL